MPLGETIVAPATPDGESAIAMIRASGPLCFDIIKNALGTNKHPIERKSTLAYYTNKNGKTIDQVLYTYYPEHSSYTGEPSIEICCHGNPLIVQKISEDLVDRGCRLAQGGEFTRTAFINGKMDLAQAEAVCDLITARSEIALDAAQKQLAGALGEKVDEYTDRLLQIIAEIEAYIDFPEDDLPPERADDILRRIESLTVDFEDLIATSQYRHLLQNGIKTVIIGAPNAGKSSLLNTLVGEERAIVSPTPGTTRDFISEQIMIGRYSIRIMDTAGLHDTFDEIEQQGIKKTIEKIKEADFHILVIDLSTPPPPLPHEILRCLNTQTTLILENKMDLPPYKNETPFLQEYPRCQVSLKTKKGTAELRSKLEEIFNKNIVKTTADGLTVSARHAAALKSSKEALIISQTALQENQATEIIASELRQALRSLQEIVGEIDNEIILDKLFSTFCIGK